MRGSIGGARRPINTLGGWVWLREKRLHPLAGPIFVVQLAGANTGSVGLQGGRGALDPGPVGGRERG
jgi:hypothetical protein